MLDCEVKLTGDNAIVWDMIRARKFFDAKRICGRAFRKDPNDLQALFFMGYVYLAEWQLDRAKKCFRYLAHKAPENHTIWGNYALALSRGGEAREAIKINERIKHMDDGAWSNLLLWYCSIENDPNMLLKRHTDYGRKIDKTERLLCYDHDYRENKRLRIGIATSDLYSHAVSNFIRPILKHAKSHGIDIYAYRTGGGTDAVTQELRGYAAKWTECENMSNAKLAGAIKGDGIDILFDLEGHSNGGARLPVFAMKPAPVQITYLGYPFSTGTGCYDGRIVDGITDPEDIATEPLVRLDRCFLCYTPGMCDLPEIKPVKSARFSFGSFARAEKITPEVVAAWSRILRNCEHANLVLKAICYRDVYTRARYIAEFEKNGIDKSRLVFLPYAKDQRNHLDCYNRYDLMLDTFPYNGTTTLCESLVMGAPAVTIIGASHQARVAYSILHSVGVVSMSPKLGEYVATDILDYIALAIAAYNKGAPDAFARTELRNSVLHSNLCDSQGFAKSFFGALKQLWVDKCRSVKTEEAVTA